MSRIRIGTRGSRLALKQAALVREALQRADCGMETEIVTLRTRGDRVWDKPLSEIGEKGVFASEIEQALAEERIDLAVHSAKDLPMALQEGLVIAAVLPRADVRDVLVIPKNGRLPCPAGDRRTDEEDAARTFLLGSGSRRRQFLAGQLWRNVRCESIRGNVDTRLGKLQKGAYDGILLAKAGLDRLGIGSDGFGRNDFTFCPLPPETFLPAACQGILAVEAVQGSGMAELCRRITDAETELCFRIEREVLAQLAADCSEAAAAWCRREQGRLALDVMYGGYRQSVASQDGGRCGEERPDDRSELSAGLELARRAAVQVRDKARLRENAGRHSDEQAGKEKSGT